MIRDLANPFVGVAKTVGENIIRGNGDHFFDGSGVGVDVLHLVQLVSERSNVPRGIAGVRLAIPPLAGVVETRPDLVCTVRRAGKNVVRTFRISAVVIARTGAAEVMTGYNDPLEAFVDEHIDDVARVGHFRGEKPLGMVTEVGTPSPRLPPSLFENLDFLAKNFFGQQRSQRMVMGETDQIQAPFLAAGGVARIPAAAITQVPTAAKLAHVINQSTRITHGKPATGESAQR